MNDGLVLRDQITRDRDAGALVRPPELANITAASRTVFKVVHKL